MNLAAASGEDLATTSDIVTDALTAFGLSAGDSGHFANVMAVAASNANTNVGLMGETFKYVAPVAGALGYSVDDTALAIGLMANSGIKATQAGTALRSIFTRLSTDAGSSSKQLGALGVLTEKLGVEFYNTDGSARNLNDVLLDSRSAWAGLSEEQQIAYAKTILSHSCRATHTYEHCCCCHRKHAWNAAQRSHGPDHTRIYPRRREAAEDPKTALW